MRRSRCGFSVARYSIRDARRPADACRSAMKAGEGGVVLTNVGGCFPLEGVSTDSAQRPKRIG